MYDADVIVVGAGLTGLRAALALSRAGVSTLVVEREQAIGGRIRTSLIEGFRLDHGFQVLLSGYPELTLIDGIESLRSKPFTSGARIRWGGRFYDLLDPRKHPAGLIRALTLPFTSIRDLLQLARLSTFYRDPEVRADNRSTAELLDNYRFSPPFRQAFLQPFLAGVLLDQALSADSALSRFYLKVFSEGPAVLPHDGMQALPQLLANQLGSSHIALGTGAAALTAREVVLENGETLRARQVVCALDSLSAARLGSPEQTIPAHATRVLYYTSDQPPFTEPILVLNGEGVGPINNLAVLTNVQPSYAPSGASLISITTLGAHSHREEDALRQKVGLQLRQWYGEQATKWRFLHTYHIPAAVPARPRLGSGWIEHNGIYFAGDYLAYGSQNAALRAGRHVAEGVLQEVSLGG